MKFKRILAIFSILIMSSFFVSAGFGVGFPNSVSGGPGEEIDEVFSIQNVIDPTDDIELEIEVTKGSDYLVFPQGTSISVLAGELKSVPVKIVIPSNAKGSYDVEVLFKPVEGSVGGGGTVDLSVGIGKSFDIKVLSETSSGDSSSNSGILFLLIGVIVVALIAFFLARRKKEI